MENLSYISPLATQLNWSHYSELLEEKETKALDFVKNPILIKNNSNYNEKNDIYKFSENV